MQNHSNAGQTRTGQPQGRYWLGTIHADHQGGTLPNTSTWGELLGRNSLVWLRGQKEVGEGGREHIQVFACFSKKIRRNTLITIIPGHWELSRSDAAESYVWKEETRIPGTQFEFGQRPFKRNCQTDWNRIMELAKRGAIDTIMQDEPQIAIQHYRTFKQIKVDYMVAPENLPAACGKWIYGPPRVGKSFWVRQQWGHDLYIKAQNKWWDGYQGQKFVLLDDFDAKVLGHYLKIWMDAYAFTAETKHGTVQIRPNLFIITSNYKVEEIFNDDPILADAISQRCQKIYIPFKRY